VKQQGNTGQMVFSIPELLEEITNRITLEPGDVIATGTPAGVGPLQPGDTVEVEIKGVGILRNRVERAESD
jgi:2-keto-4-pentenoate hydratase/2-oxohepta-3-ene-1,7-dioic acid hydratase in catechol pathway